LSSLGILKDGQNALGTRISVIEKWVELEGGHIRDVDEMFTEALAKCQVDISHCEVNIAKLRGELDMLRQRLKYIEQ